MKVPDEAKAAPAGNVGDLGGNYELCGSCNRPAVMAEHNGMARCWACGAVTKRPDGVGAATLPLSPGDVDALPHPNADDALGYLRVFNTKATDQFSTKPIRDGWRADVSPRMNFTGLGGRNVSKG